MTLSNKLTKHERSIGELYQRNVRMMPGGTKVQQCLQTAPNPPVLCDMYEKLIRFEAEPTFLRRSRPGREVMKNCYS